MINNNKARALALLVMLVVALGVGTTFWASSMHANIYGPTLLTEDSEGNIWLLIDDDFYIVDPSGRFKSVLALEQLGISAPVAAIEPLADGTLLIGSRETGLIHQIAVDGSVVAKIDPASSSSGRLFGAFHLAYDADEGELWVADTSNHRLLIFNLDGKLLDQFGSSDQPQGPFRFPNDIEIVERGRALLVDTNHHNIKLLDRSLTATDSYHVSWRNRSPFRWPAMLERDSTGNLYVSVLGNGMTVGEVRKLDSQGKFQFAFELDPGAEPTDLLVRGNNDVLIADEGNFSITRFALDGGPKGVFGDASIRHELARLEQQRATYKNLESASQVGLLLVLLILVTAYAVQSRGRMRQARDPRRSLIVAFRPAPRVFVSAPARVLLRSYLAYLRIFIAAFPYLPILLVMHLVILSYANPSSAWRLGWYSEALLVLAALAFCAYQLLHRHVSNGLFSSVLTSEREKLLEQLNAPIRATLRSGEAIVRHTHGQMGHFSKLLILTEHRLILFTLSTRGRLVHGPTFLPLHTIELAQVLPPSRDWWQVFSGRAPAVALHIEVSGGECLHVDLMEQPGAEDFCRTLLRHSEKADPAVQPDTAAGDAPTRAISTAKLVLLSALFPGIGQLAQGRFGTGLLYLVLAWYYLFVLMGPIAAMVLRTSDIVQSQVIAVLASAAFLWALSLYDTYRYAMQVQSLRQVGH